jgi:hypothetical protein
MHLNRFITYLKLRWPFALVIGYMIFSMILRATTAIDLCIPCLWETCFGFHCPGCGLTRATIAIMQLDFTKAYECNPLVFLVLPAGAFYTFLDYKKTNKTLHKG